MSQDQQSESKAWWQTLPGLLTAGAAVLTAFTGLLVALNQMGVFHHSHPPPAPAQSSAPAAIESSGPAGAQAPAANPAAAQLGLPANAEMRTEHAVYTLLSARVSPYSPGEIALDFTVRMTNQDSYDANFWVASFRLSVNGALQPPASDLDELVPAHSAKEGEIEFVIPANTSTVGLQMGNVGEGKPAITIHLQNP
ncbi:MAG: hypothetical protein WBE38_09765 [Terracidiphilus sp.]